MTTRSKSVTHQDLILAARAGLLPVAERGWLGGFGNMLRKELGQWWGTNTWWVQTLIWVLILNGISTIVALTESGTPATRMQEVIQTFLPMTVGVIGMGTVITAQGAIVGEKQLGTVAWVMSKPASRSAFILAKVVAYTLGFWATAIFIPSAIFLLVTRLFLPVPFSLPAFLAGVSLAALSQFFYLTLTLMLGTFFNSRGPITGIGIAFIMVGMLLKSFIPLPVMIVTPWPLPELSGMLALEMPLPSFWLVPVVATASWAVLMLGVALWRFGREEF